MPQPLRVALVLPIVYALLALPAAAQPPGTAAGSPPREVVPGARAPAGVEQELARLNRTLERIATLLERQVEGQRLDLSLKRIELQTRRVETLEGELRGAEERQRSIEDQREQLQSQLEMFASQLEGMEPEELEGSRARFRMMVDQVEAEVDRLERRLQETVQEVLELDNELTRRRDDLQAIQDRVDRELEGM